MKKQIAISVLIIAFLTLFFSCQDESDIKIEGKLTKEKLEKYLKSRGNNYVFHDLKTVYKQKGKKIPKALHFKSIDELAYFLDEMDKIKDKKGIINTRDAITSLPPEGSGEGSGESPNYHSSKIYLGGFCPVYLNIGFAIDKCKGSSFRSWISGCTIGLAYTEHYTNLRDDTQNRRINYFVSGILDYHIFVEGIGTYYTENVSARGYHQCK